MTPGANITFTLLIKVNGRLREFNFRRRPDLHYDTDTNDDHGNRYMFRLVKEEDQWKIKGSSLPGWLTNSEAVLGEALENAQPAGK